MQACVFSCVISNNLQEVAMAVAAAMVVKAVLKVGTSFPRRGFPTGC